MLPAVWGLLPFAVSAAACAEPSAASFAVSGSPKAFGSAPEPALTEVGSSAGSVALALESV